MTLVNVVFRKYDGSLHWNYLATRLGEDEHGVWLGAPLGTELRRGEAVMELAEMAHVVLLPRAGWWTAAFNAPPKRTEIYCDISTVPEWTSADEVTMIDLDLDVLRRAHRPGRTGRRGRVRRAPGPLRLSARGHRQRAGLGRLARRRRRRPPGAVRHDLPGVAGPGQLSRSTRVSFSGLTWL